MIINNDELTLDLDDKELIFQRVEIIFDNTLYQNLFSQKNNKTLLETLDHRRYRSLRKIIMENYSNFLDYKLGEFLRIIKDNGDENYKLFLNSYGDLEYSIFCINDHRFLNRKGLYCYSVNNKLKYIGRCLDNYKKRINQGYGKIHPKNCYKDGQATNCHLNSLITRNKKLVSLWVHPLNNSEEIIRIENDLIEKYTPEWNIKPGSTMLRSKNYKGGGKEMVDIISKKNRIGTNEKFEEFWRQLTEVLSEEQIIRNWTADKGYLGKGDFKSKWQGSNYVECNPPEAEMIQKVPKQDFQLMYEYWKAYTNGNMRRADLRDESRFTKYTISIIHKFEELM